MFSPENKRFSLLIIAVVILSLMTLGTMFGVYVETPSGMSSTPMITAVTGFISIMILQLLSMLKSEQSREESSLHRQQISNDVREAKEKVQEIDDKVNGNLREAIATTAEEVRKAERDQILNELPLPKTSHELELMLKDFAQRFCREVADDAGRMAAEKVIREHNDLQKPQGDNHA